MSARTCQLTTGLMFTSPQTEFNDHSDCLEGMFRQHVDSPAAVGIPDRNHRYKSVTTQILQYARLALIPNTDRKIPPPPGIEPAPHLVLGA